MLSTVISTIRDFNCKANRAKHFELFLGNIPCFRQDRAVFFDFGIFSVRLQLVKLAKSQIVPNSRSLIAETTVSTIGTIDIDTKDQLFKNTYPFDAVYSGPIKEDSSMTPLFTSFNRYESAKAPEIPSEFIREQSQTGF